VSLAYARDDTHLRIVLTVTGTVTRDEWRQAISRQIGEGTWHYGVLYDAMHPQARLPGPSISAAITRDALHLHREVGPRGPVAFAIANPETHTEFREWANAIGLALPYPVEIFHTRHEAERWLNRMRRSRR
jgi:hypothetical protein